MRIVFCFLLSLLFGAGLSHGDPIAEVIGVGECVDCVESKIEPTRALEGLRVSIVCRTPQGKILKTKGVGEFDGEGNFKVTLPDELVEDGKLKEECYAQLQSALAKPCPAHGGLELNRIMLKNRSEDGQKHIFGLAGKLKFSPILCDSATFWHYFKHHHHHFNCPPKEKISPPEHKKPDPVPVPVYKKPDPAPVPVYKKPDPVPVPVYKKPDPPPVPVYKKPHPSPEPVYKKPHPSPEPVYKKPDPTPVPVYKKPDPSPVPVYKKPDPQPAPYHKSFPKIPKITLPPFHHKSFPPFHFPRFHHHHHWFHHHHHHFGNFPPLTPPHTDELIN